MIRSLYYTLDHRLIIGKNQIIDVDQESPEAEQRPDYDSVSLNRLKFLIKERNFRQLEDEILRSFAEWEKKRYTQLSVEEKVREIFRIFRCENMLDESVENSEYFIDDAFYYAENMNKLAENICQILCRNRMEEVQKIKIDTPEFFEKIEAYMKEHLRTDVRPENMQCFRNFADLSEPPVPKIQQDELQQAAGYFPGGEGAENHGGK